MNLDNLNRWLTLAANIGVLIGIFAVVTELRQTQTIMSAESSMQRAQFSRENASLAAQSRIDELAQKVNAGNELSAEEYARAQEWVDRLLRHHEVMHYQNSIGVLDEEIWTNNLEGIRGSINGPLLNYLYPDWPNGGIALRLRQSFVDLTMELKE